VASILFEGFLPFYYVYESSRLTKSKLCERGAKLSIVRFHFIRLIHTTNNPERETVEWKKLTMADART
jgi:hypothetical protein